MQNKVILLSGKSSTGKSASLQNLKNPEGVLYLNCEAGKSTPFNNKFQERVITDPLHVPGYIETWEKKEDIHTIVIDSLSFMMEQYESQYVIPSTNTMKALH